MPNSLTLEQIIGFLLETPMFGELDEAELAEVVHIMQVQRFRDGQPVFAEGEDGDAWYVIFEGSGGVSKAGSFGGERDLATLGPRDCFGEMAILDGSPRSATVRARDGLTVFRFPRGPFQELIAMNNVGAYKLVFQMARVLSGRQRALNQELFELMDTGHEVASGEGLKRRIGPLVDRYTVSE